ncbi:MAG: hypothetical protein Q7J80_09985 [Anaerolineales bacterium]|nr:hypothetical protein [Anaerolineales bacterium]
MIATFSAVAHATELSIPAPHVDWSAILNDPRTLASLLRNRKLLGYGAFGVVYEVQGAAIKIGCVDDNEPIIQQWVYETHARALPVWAFKQEVILPRVVTREVCPRHGYPSDLWTPTSINCHCGEALAALVMPVADFPDMLLLEGVDADHIWQTVYDAVLNKFGVSLDLHWRNMISLQGQGRLLVCDFGDINSKLVSLW